jgi:hypothetical protein
LIRTAVRPMFCQRASSFTDWVLGSVSKLHA